jgi:PAS domain S-box-containing protein
MSGTQQLRDDGFMTRDRQIDGDVESLSLLESLQSCAPFGLGLLDLDYRFVRVNDALAAMNGVPAAEHVGRPVSDVVPALWAQVEPMLAGIVKFRESVTRELVGASPADPTRTGTWLNTFYPVCVDGELVGIGLVVVELTKQRRSEQLHSVIMQTMVEGLLALDQDGRVTFVNAAAERMLGWSEAELRDRYAHGVVTGHGAEIESARRQRRAVRSMEEAFMRRDGRMLPVMCSITPKPYGGSVIVFQDATEEIERRRSAERELDAVTWVGRIREAVDEDRLELYTQPIIPLAGGTAREELLLRMTTRGGEVVPAGQFLPAAEQFGLIVELDRWVIAQAMRIAAHGRIVQVNLSAASTADARLLDFIDHELRAGEAPPSNVIFELTETALMSNAAAGEAFAGGLVELGCGLALDDFGTGFGSLTYLKRLPVQSLKIDVDFVRDLPDNEANQHLVRAIVSLARSFGNETVAEGVENEETLALLRAYGVDYAQGFYVSRPAPVAQRNDRPPVRPVLTQRGPDSTVPPTAPPRAA